MTNFTQIETDDCQIEPSDQLLELLKRLAAGRCQALVVHGKNHAAFYNEGGDVWPMHFRTLREHGADPIHAGTKPTPSLGASNVVFARHDATEGEESGWMEFKIRGDDR